MPLYVPALGATNVWTGSNTFPNTGLKVLDSNGDAVVTIAPGNESASRTLSIPVLGGADTLATLGLANTFTGNNTFPKILTATTVGTVTTGATTTAEEHGDGFRHITKLTMTAFVVGTVQSSTTLGIGASFYTLPAGAIQVEDATLSGFLLGAGSTKTGTPEVGIGTVIASGTIATLTTATFENIMDGGASGGSGTGSDASLVAPDLNSTVFQKTSLSTIKPMIKTSGGQAKELFLNAALAWGANTGGALTFTGVITLRWRIIS